MHLGAFTFFSDHFRFPQNQLPRKRWVISQAEEWSSEVDCWQAGEETLGFPRVWTSGHLWTWRHTHLGRGSVCWEITLQGTQIRRGENFLKSENLSAGYCLLIYYYFLHSKAFSTIVLKCSSFVWRGRHLSKNNKWGAAPRGRPLTAAVMRKCISSVALECLLEMQMPKHPALSRSSLL